MANYALLLDCSIGTTNNELEGVFDVTRWVSTTNNSTPNPATTALSLNPGDQVAFAVNVTTAGATLNWVAVMLDAVTLPGNRTQRAANNNSPFAITAGRPTILLLVTNLGPSSVWPFTKFDSGGNASSAGPYQGVQYLPVVKDLPPGSSTPNRAISQFEAVIVASVTANGQTWQFGFDPEMDVNNNN